MFLCAMHFLDFSRAEALKKQKFRQKARWRMGEVFKMGLRERHNTRIRMKSVKWRILRQTLRKSLRFVTYDFGNIILA